MLSWLKNNEIDRIKLDESGWKLREKSSDVKIWENQAGDVLSLNFFDKVPDIPVSLSQITELRNFYRNLVSGSGGVLKIEVIEIKGLSAIECLFKIPMQPSGMIYVASFTIPFREKSYVVKIQCPESGITGERDAIVFAMQDNFDYDEEEEDFDPFKGWANDPYDETLSEGILMNLSEDEKYDAKFPNHPLSRARRYLRQIEQTMTVDKRLFELPRFS